jgi:hypothetical protein
MTTTTPSLFHFVPHPKPQGHTPISENRVQVDRHADSLPCYSQYLINQLNLHYLKKVNVKGHLLLVPLDITC